MISRWLVEYIGSTPCPVYASRGTYPTCDPYEAISFDTEERAKKWMKVKGTVPYPPPWTPVQHGFED